MSEHTQGLLVVAVEDGLYEGRLVHAGEKFRVGVAQAIRQPAAPPGGLWVRATAGPHADVNHFAGSYKHDDGVGIRRSHGDVFLLREGDQIGAWMEPGRLGPVPENKPDATLEERFIFDPTVLPGWRGTKWNNGKVPHQKAGPETARTFSEINKQKDREDLALATKFDGPPQPRSKRAKGETP